MEFEELPDSFFAKNFNKKAIKQLNAFILFSALVIIR